VTEPANAREIEYYYGLPYLNWKYGIATTIGRPTEVHGYFVQRYGDENDWEYIPADEMSHVKANVDRNVKRGMSDYYAVDEWIRDASKLLKNTMQGGAIQAAIALVREWEGRVRGIGAAADGAVEFQSQLPSRLGGSRQIPTERFFPGKILDVQGAKYHPGPMGSSAAGTYIDIGQAGMRKAANRWCMPEFMYTGDASNANYSSTLVSESPFVRFCEALQATQENEDRGILWRVVKLYMDRDSTAPWDFARVQALTNIDATPPPVATNDRDLETRIATQLNSAKLLSKKTWAAREGLDYEVEQQNIAEEGSGPTLATTLESAKTTDEVFSVLEGLRR